MSTKKSLLDLYEEAQALTESLNNLDFSKEEEMAQHERLLIQMDNIEQTLSGDVSAQRKTNKTTFYIQ